MTLNNSNVQYSWLISIIQYFRPSWVLDGLWNTAYISDHTTVGNYVAFNLGQTVRVKAITLDFWEMKHFLNTEVSYFIFLNIQGARGI